MFCNSFKICIPPRNLKKPGVNEVVNSGFRLTVVLGKKNGMEMEETKQLK